MPKQPKISIITVCLNSEKTLERTIQSIITQQYTNVEFLVIDGASTDGTLSIIRKYRSHIHFMLSESDNGMYDAINKAIKAAGGDIIGVLNADDVYADDNVLTVIVQAFERENADILYGNLIYVKPDGQILRKWISKTYKHGLFNFGWMPPHPTFFCKKELFERLGFYNVDFGTAGDYELMVRFMHHYKVKSYYLDKIIVKMNAGGLSNASLKNRLRAWKNDHKAMGKNGVKFPLFALLAKPLRKLGQFF